MRAVRTLHTRRREPSRLALLLGAFLAIGCKAYDTKLLREPNPAPPPVDAGHDSGTGGSGGGDDAEVCPGVPEQCNGADDDCDGRTDEDTQLLCEQMVPNSIVQCIEFEGAGRCVGTDCLDGFFNCDGEPANGCEPYCSCHPCDDAGTEDAGL